MEQIIKVEQEHLILQGKMQIAERLLAFQLIIKKFSGRSNPHLSKAHQSKKIGQFKKVTVTKKMYNKENFNSEIQVT
jgi:hypothetical protein